MFRQVPDIGSQWIPFETTGFGWVPH